jgi:hypothetical protein
MGRCAKALARPKWKFAEEQAKTDATGKSILDARGVGQGIVTASRCFSPPQPMPQIDGLPPPITSRKRADLGRGRAGRADPASVRRDPQREQ